MWEVEPTTRWSKDQRFYAKKRPSELAAVLHNLERYLEQITAAPNPKVVQGGYLHPEPGGVVAIDQKGGGGNLQQTRLYTYAYAERNVLYLIAIGDKQSQPADIQFCSKFVKNLQEGKF